MPTPPQQTTAGEGDCNHEHSQPVRMTWARLLRRVFDIDIEHCTCGGKLKLIAIIEEPTVIEKILKHIGLDPQPPPIAPASGIVGVGVRESDGIYRAEGVVRHMQKQGWKYSTKSMY